MGWPEGKIITPPPIITRTADQSVPHTLLGWELNCEARKRTKNLTAAVRPHEEKGMEATASIWIEFEKARRGYEIVRRGWRAKNGDVMS